MKVRTILLSMVLVAGVSLNVSAQFKIGGKSINTKKLVNAASDAAKAVTLSDEDVAAMAREYIQWMDTHNEIAGPETAMGQRLANLTKDIKVEGLDLNFKVYNVIDVNAFACGDGSVRVCGGLMKIMDDNEVLAVIGHEIGHVVHQDTKHAMKNAYLRSAAKNVAGAVSETASKLTDSQLGALAEAFMGAQFSQKQEFAADDYAFDFCLQQKVDPYAMSKALTKLVELSNAGGEKASRIQQMFSTHPDSEARAARLKERADKLQK